MGKTITTKIRATTTPTMTKATTTDIYTRNRKEKGKKGKNDGVKEKE